MAQPALTRLSRSVTLSKTPAELWPLLSATDRLNREWGLPPVQYKPAPNARGGSDLNAEATAMGTRVVWKEQPYEWIEPVLWSVRREYQSGPLKIGIFGLKLERTTDAKTVATFYCEYLPSGMMNNIFARFAINDWLKKATQVATTADDFLNKRSPVAYARRFKRYPIDRDALQDGILKLIESGVREDVAQHLSRDIEMLPEEDVVRMRPFELARRWNAERLETLTACMRAVRFGLFDMLWQTVCPHCRGASAGHGALKQIRSKSRCDFCNVEFDSEFDRSIEATFSVNPSVRKTRDLVYCIGGPGKTPHIHAQFRMEPGEKREVKLPLAAGNYRFRAVQFPTTQKLFVTDEKSDSAPPIKVTVTDKEFQLSSDKIPAGTATIQFEAASTAFIDLKLERADWLDNIATGTVVSSIPEFYDMAAKDLVLPEEDLSVRSVTLLFSDLRGSTAMYKQFGDAAAYAIVREHFKVMTEVILKHEGGIVKTIGDAVMAVFTTAPKALECCFETQRAFVELWKKRPQTIPIVVKLGFHRGPCIVVNLNNRIDYFGTTANLAARIQNESQGGDIVFMEEFLLEPAIQEVVKKYTCSEKVFSANLKGIVTEANLVRITPKWEGKSLPQGTIIAVKPIFDAKRGAPSP